MASWELVAIRWPPRASGAGGRARPGSWRPSLTGSIPGATGSWRGSSRAAAGLGSGGALLTLLGGVWWPVIGQGQGRGMPLISDLKSKSEMGNQSQSNQIVVIHLIIVQLCQYTLVKQ